MKYVYPCNIVLDEEADGESYVVTFPDVYGATTGGLPWEEALGNAEDALVAALGALTIASRKKSLCPAPLPTDRHADSLTSHRCFQSGILNTAMRQQGVTTEILAEKMGLTRPAVQKLCNPDAYSHF